MIKSFKSEIYPITFFLCVGKTVEEIVVGVCKKVEINKDYLLNELNHLSKAAAFAYENGGIIIISIPRGEGAYYNGLVSHEISHATFFVCDRLGIDVTTSPQEAYCYLNGWITEKVWSLIEKDINKK